ncbi:MAG: SRPBCC domain-containing protein [Actinomycetota bacterium]|nr:SRPBCC domain-containing protein [Actinomycetota bacterium]
MRELTTSIVIESSPEAVWDTLMDFESYPEWNPFVTNVSGNAAVGERLDAALQNPGGKKMNISPFVTASEKNRRFSWLGRLGIKGLFDGHHYFEIEPSTDGSTRFTQREEFSGILVPILWKMLDTKTRAGFEAMNAALKDRVEAL